MEMPSSQKQLKQRIANKHCESKGVINGREHSCQEPCHVLPCPSSYILDGGLQGKDEMKIPDMSWGTSAFLSFF